MRRPMWRTETRGWSHVTTPRTAALMSLLGSRADHESVALSADECKAVQKLYGYTQEPNTPAGRFMQAGADRNASRHASCDGLRMVAWIAKYTPAGADPLKILVELASAAGWDVPPEDVEWSMSEADETAEEAP